MGNPAIIDDPGPASSVGGLLARGADAAHARGRPDLNERLRTAAARLASPSVLVCVIGEYKVGKSALVNALVGQDVCPVDDFYPTTTVTAVHHGPEPGARVRSVDPGDGHRSMTDIDMAEVIAYAADGPAAEHSGSPATLGVEAVEVAVPSPFLRSGLTLLDTPGASGLLAEQAPIMLRFLSVSHGALFVTDAGAELSAPELEFLGQARRRCPRLLVVVTKCDLHPSWEKIVELDRGHLAAAGIDAEVHAVSSTLCRAAGSIGRPDRERDALDRESGIPALAAAVHRDIVAGARAESGRIGADELRSALGQLRIEAEAEIRAIEDPAGRASRLEAYEEACRRLATLQGAGARWTTVLGDGIADLRLSVDYRLRTGLQTAREEAEQLLEGVDPVTGWEDVQRGLRAAIGRELGGVLDLIDDGALELQQRLAAGFAGFDLGDPELPRPEQLIDFGGVTAGREPSHHGPGIAAGLAAARGGSSGIVLLGVLAGLAGVAVATPVAIGVGAAFGTKQVVDLHKREIERRHQEARALIRQVVERVRLDTAVAVRGAVDDLHRSLRDHYAARVKETIETYTRSARSLGVAAREAQAAAEARLPDLRREVVAMDEMLTDVDAADPARAGER